MRPESEKSWTPCGRKMRPCAPGAMPRIAKKSGCLASAAQAYMVPFCVCLAIQGALPVMPALRKTATRKLGRMSVHHYARVAGVVLAALGLGGLLGLWYVKPGSIALYLTTAAVFSYTGFLRPGRRDCLYIVGGLGVLYFLSGGLLALAYLLPTIPADYHDRAHSIVRLTIGTLCFLAAYYLPDRVSSGSPTEEERPDDPEQYRQ